MLKDFRNPEEFPRPFWVLMLGTFIDHIGSFMLLPFFALYITQHFGLSMTGLGGIFFWHIEQDWLDGDHQLVRAASAAFLK